MISRSAATVAARYSTQQGWKGMSRTAAVTGDGTGVGLFIPLPPELAPQFPKKAEDTSPPHVTFLYIGDVPPDRQADLVDVLGDAFSSARKTVAVLNGLDYFTNPPKNRVAFCRIRFSQDLSVLRETVWRKLEAAGFTVADSFPRYNPHSTIAYLPDLAGRWEGPVPSGRWEFSAIEVWGMSQKKVIPFGVELPAFLPALGEEGVARVARITAKRANAIALRRNWE